MLQETQRRLDGLECGPAVVVCNAEHRFMVAEQLRGETAENPTIILEPAGRNTAPAIALAALQAQAQQPDALLLVLPADHHVRDPAAFRAAVERAAAPAQAGKLMTFGVVPSRPETGYGYVRCGEALADGDFSSRRIRREARSGHRGGLCGRRHVLLEQRPVSVSGRSLPRGAGTASTGHACGLRAGHGQSRARSRLYSPRCRGLLRALQTASIMR